MAHERPNDKFEVNFGDESNLMAKSDLDCGNQLVAGS